jgi:molybdopterin-guanine dinucleotide biosynthesis protein A
VSREESSILGGTRGGRKFPNAEERKRQPQQRAAARPAIGYVLAGGASSRFSRDKALVKLGGRPLLARTLESLKSSGVREARIVGDKAKYGGFGARCVDDKWPGEGPLGGILTALRSSGVDKYGYRWNLVLSCDMPFVLPQWLAFMIERSKVSEAEVVVPQSDHGMEPLCACWRTDALVKLQDAFDQGVRKVTEAMKRLRMEVLDEAHWKRFDSHGRLFWNMNTPLDYEEAQLIFEAAK